jgi:hypothetical protein
LTLALDAVLDAAALPAPAVGVALSAGLRRGAWSGLGYGLLLPEQSDASGGEGRLAFSLIAAGLRGCYSLGTGALRTSACAGIELGRIDAEGIGLVGAARYRDLWLASSAGLELGGALGSSWFWTARGDALVPILREEYFVNQTDFVHRAALPDLRAGLGAGVAFE